VIVLLASALAAAAVLVSGKPSSCARLQRVLPAPEAPARGAPEGSGRLRHLAAAASGCALFLSVGGAAGAACAILAAVLLSRWLAGLEPRAARHRRQRIEADVPVAADLLAACLLAGCSPVTAAEAVSEALGGPLAAELRGVVAALRLGAEPAGAWLRLVHEPVLAPLGQACARALQTGAPLADAMTRLADERRTARRWSAEAAARRAGVRAAAPLGVCFLPAFVLVGVVPAIAGIATEVLR
jgi:Flp pilus assembly protein TadB